MAKKKKDQHNLGKEKMQNLVAKHSRNMAGAGAHVDKKGNKAPRVRQKRQWKKEMMEKTLIQTANESIVDDPFADAIAEVEKKFNISLAEGKCGSENEESSFSSQQLADMKKLISQYKAGDADVSSVGNDLEMLEYNPDDVGPMISYIRSALKK